ncbi:MAG: glycosyltransferase family 2 protein [Syntrophorhabdaceae bacterium]|nr:glycosyltransferase family 2 protein [Syntrophorhabdaceae bacterium]
MILDMRLPISIYIITFNNGATIERALKSVAGWADEIIVVDSHSTDGTAEIAARYTDKLYQYDTTNLRDKYQFAHDRCSNTWVMFIDADEWLTDKIKDEIVGILKSNTVNDGFMVKRRNIYLGREIRFGGWYPDHEIRLYRKDRGGWQGGIHAKVHVKGRIGRLKNHYMHTPYVDTSHQIKTIDRYSGAYAEDLFQSGRRFHLFNMLLRPVYRFFRDYMFKLGFLDGIPGLIIMASTMYYVFMKHAKLWELEKKNEKKGDFQG